MIKDTIYAKIESMDIKSFKCDNAIFRVEVLEDKEKIKEMVINKDEIRRK